MLFGNKKSTIDWLVVGLGNPGLQYEKTRHNVGFMSVDKLAEDYGAELNKTKFDAVFGEFKRNDMRIMIAKPQTYMNLSGKAVTAICNFYKIPVDRIIIISDDISLDVGRIRIRRKGSHGGHNGLRDIFELMGTDEIIRIKVGVGKKPSPDYDLKNWVLGRFPESEKGKLETALSNVSKAVVEILSNGIDSAMNKFNS